MSTNTNPAGLATTIVGKAIKATDFKVVYCNAMRMGAGPYDVQIMFGSMREQNGPEEQAVEEQVMVIMSPQHAKAMINSLRVTIETYENTFGFIPDAAAVAVALMNKANETSENST